MGGLFNSLSVSAQSLDAQRYGLDVTGQNIANLNTDGYARRTLELGERIPVDGVGGVQVIGVRATRDAFVDQRLRNELPAESRDQAMSSALTVVETSFGTAGDSIDGALSGLFGAFSKLTVDPQSSVARDGVVIQAKRLSRSFNDMAQRLSSSLRQADSDVRASVGQINQLATRIAAINEKIGDAPANADTQPLQDQLDVALRDLSKITAISVIAQPEGTVDVSLGSGRAIAIGARSYALTVTNAPVTGLAVIRAGGVDISSDLQSGSLGGQLAIRDDVLPGYQSQLDQLAYDVATQVNAVHSAGYDLSGNTGQDLFAVPASAAGAAAAFQVHAAIAADATKIAASGDGVRGDNATAKALADLRGARAARGGTTTFTDSWSLIVNAVGTDSAAATASLTTRHGVVTAIQRLRDSVSGVSLDEEAGRLMQFQRAYEANARFFVAVNDALSTLMSTFGAAR
jgi:flagellar hook-associated protein 1 FlgK